MEVRARRGAKTWSRRLDPRHNYIMTPEIQVLTGYARV